MITDAEEGLILTDVNTLADGEPRNNFLERAVTWNEENLLKGASHITLAGYYAYAADIGIVVVNLDNPLKPTLASVIPLKDVRSTRVAVPLPVRDRRRGHARGRCHAPGQAEGGQE